MTGVFQTLPPPDQVVLIGWGLWIVSWWLAALWRDRAVKRPPTADEIAYRVLTTAGALALFWYPRGARIGGLFDVVLWRAAEPVRWALCLAIALGWAFTWWARVHLGRLWSSSVTRKAGHHVVDTGPYRLVRHPIYTGILTALIGTAALRGSLVAVVGIVLFTTGFYLKATLEERFLREELAAAYDDYKRRVPMLIPFTR